MLCPSCSSSVPDESRFCGVCGDAVHPGSAATRTFVGSWSRTPISTPTLDNARFLPGAMVADRYRIVGLLGRGGMGEVYRADDLKLGQPVALKFLPATLADDEHRLQRFLHEVKIARQVSHPNVCRVYDVGETDGQHYLSMEYVDGEDLSTLLRRIGRLPEDKAVQIARQLCAGLAAAHEQGILHRDIKPANVMIDGRGRTRLTDFGLAGLADGFQGAEVRAGTPTYMAPEQITGKEVSIRSDVYALGLVLYELFTGKRAFDAGSAIELTQKQLGTTPTSPSSFMTGFDSAVERVILQCLEKNPADRPPSALAVAAALPGGDPLAAALAAGETPSPEMVAAAGPQGGLRPAVATACLAAVMLIWVLSWFPIQSYRPYDHLPFVKSYEALKENARDIAKRLGFDEVPQYRWAGFGLDNNEYGFLVREHGPAAVAEQIARPDQAFLWMDYRQRDSPFASMLLNGRVNWSMPQPSSGEVAMELDLQGHLTHLRVTPSLRESEEEQEATDVDWATLFDVAGFDISLFESVAPTTRPGNYADTRAAWTGTLAGDGDRPVRIEAAALDGKPVYFSRMLPSDPLWTAAGSPPPGLDRRFLIAGVVILLALALLAVAGGLFLAVRNLKLGRGDRKGAFRIAAFVFATRFLHWVLAGDHVGHPLELLPLTITVCGAVTLALLAWVLYVACEPYARKLWPQAMVSWTRVLAGRFRDPLVGRDVLVGCTATSLSSAVVLTTFWGGEQAGILGVIPDTNPLIMLRGGRYAVGELFAALLGSTALALTILMIFLLLRMICRKTWIAGTVLCLIMGAVAALQFAGLFGPRAMLLGLPIQILAFGVLIVVLVRFGLLATVSAIIAGQLGNISLFTFNTSAPYFGLGLFVTAVFFAFATYGWHTSLAGRSLLQEALLAHER